MQYTVAEYPREGYGEWGIFCSISRSWVLFGPEEQMRERCKQLNVKEKND